MAALLAVGAGAANSADFTLAGESSTLFLTAATGLLPESLVVIEIKSASGGYTAIGVLHVTVPAKVLTGPGTYRVTRPAGPAVGVDRV